MVKVLFLRLLVAMMCVLVSAIPAVKRQDLHLHLLSSTSTSTATSPSFSDVEDPATRSERSTNLSLHASRKIQLFIKNRHLQLLPDGTVNGTLNASGNYTVLQRTAVGVGQLKIQGVATCMYLCMDVCGLLYGSREATKECIFEEKINKDNYNTYSSVKYTNSNQTMYVAMNRYGQPRKLILKGKADLGKLASYARALTMSPTFHPIRHEAHHCRDSPSDLPEGGNAASSRCPIGNKKNKKKKKKRKCTHDDPCVKKNNNGGKKKKCGGEDASGEKCQRVTNVNKSVGGKKKQKKLIGGNKQNGGNNKNGNKKKNFKGKPNNKKNGSKRTTTTTEVLVISTTEDPMDDDYYGFENSTHIDWEDSSTASIDESSTTTTHPD